MWGLQRKFGAVHPLPGPPDDIELHYGGQAPIMADLSKCLKETQDKDNAKDPHGPKRKEKKGSPKVYMTCKESMIHSNRKLGIPP